MRARGKKDKFNGMLPDGSHFSGDSQDYVDIWDKFFEPFKANGISVYGFNPTVTFVIEGDHLQMTMKQARFFRLMIVAAEYELECMKDMESERLGNCFPDNSVRMIDIMESHAS